MQIAIGTALAALIAAAAFRARALSASGAIAAFFVGAITFGIGGWPATAVLFAFFLPSTILSRIGKARKRDLVDVGKQGARDAWQVLANGGIAALALLLSWRFGAAAAAFAGAFAAASADTWGTEIGTLARGLPRSILTLRPLATRSFGRRDAARDAGGTRRRGARRTHCRHRRRRTILTGFSGRRLRSVPRFDPGRKRTGTAMVSPLRAHLRDEPARVRSCDERAPRHCVDSKRQRQFGRYAGRRADRRGARIIIGRTGVTSGTSAGDVR